MKRVVVIGGGFAGLEVCGRLARVARRAELEIHLVDKENFFQFNPLLPEVASGAIETRHIVYPLREFCRPRGIKFYRNKLRSIDTSARVVHLHNQLSLPYDRLLIAAGSSTNYFGVPGAEEHGFAFKTLTDAIRLRSHVIEMWELADQATDAAVRRQLLTFVVAGGGITGVEVCGTLMEMFQRTMFALYPNVPPSLVSVHLIDGSDRILSAVRPEHSVIAERHLRALGVNLVMHRQVKSVDATHVSLDDGSMIPAHTLVWTTGIRGPLLAGGWPWPTGRAGRLKVGPDTRVAEGVWAVGDAADCTDADGRTVPQTAQGAIQTGRVAATNLLAELGIGKPTELRFRDYGYFVGLGKRSTFAAILGIPLRGPFAWYLWAAAYLFKMVGFRKQVEVAFDLLKGLFTLHDSSQIHDRRRMLRERDLDPELAR